MDYSWTIKYLTEFIGTALLVIFGNGAASMVRKDSKHGTLIAGAGFGIGLTIVALTFGNISGQINPGYTLGLAVSGLFKWNQVWEYIIAQLLGAIFGQFIVIAMQYKRLHDMDDATLVLSAFSTIPAADDRTYAKRGIAIIQGAVSEFFASFIFYFGIMGWTHNFFGAEVNQAINAMLKTQGQSLDSMTISAKIQNQVLPYLSGGYASQAVGAIAFGLLGFILIWLTGSAINPARDLGPRIVHSLLPASVISDAKDDSRWWYAWVPVVMPIIAGIAAVALFKIMYLK